VENYKKEKKSGKSQSYDIRTKINCGDKLLNNTKDTSDTFNKFYIYSKYFKPLSATKYYLLNLQ